MTVRNTKFLSQAFCQVVSAVGLFTGHISGGEWVAVSTLVLAVYSAGNVAAQKVGATGAQQ